MRTARLPVSLLLLAFALLCVACSGLPAPPRQPSKDVSVLAKEFATDPDSFTSRNHGWPTTIKGEIVERVQQKPGEFCEIYLKGGDMVVRVFLILDTDFERTAGRRTATVTGEFQVRYDPTAKYRLSANSKIGKQTCNFALKGATLDSAE